MKIDLEKLAEDAMVRMKNAGPRDHSLYVTTLLKIQQHLEAQSEGKWWNQLKELKEGFEATEDFEISDKYKSIFEKKNNLFLV